MGLQVRVPILLHPNNSIFRFFFVDLRFVCFYGSYADLKLVYNFLCFDVDHRCCCILGFSDDLWFFCTRGFYVDLKFSCM